MNGGKEGYNSNLRGLENIKAKAGLWLNHNMFFLLECRKKIDIGKLKLGENCYPWSNYRLKPFKHQVQGRKEKHISQ